MPSRDDKWSEFKNSHTAFWGSLETREHDWREEQESSVW
jgi:hypothetical protein